MTYQQLPQGKANPSEVRRIRMDYIAHRSDPCSPAFQPVHEVVRDLIAFGIVRDRATADALLR